MAERNDGGKTQVAMAEPDGVNEGFDRGACRRPDLAQGAGGFGAYLRIDVVQGVDQRWDRAA